MHFVLTGKATSAHFCGNLEYLVDDECVRSSGRTLFSGNLIGILKLWRINSV